MSIPKALTSATQVRRGSPKLFIELLERRKLLSAATFDPGFGTAGTAMGECLPGASAYATAVEPDGTILVGGSSSQDPTDTHFVLARFKPGGSLDRSFGSGGAVVTTLPNEENGNISAIAVQKDGKIDVVGYSFTATDANFVAARYLPGGALDPTFGTKGVVVLPEQYYNAAGSILLEADGKIVAEGGSNDGASFKLLRLTASGKLDSTFGTGGLVVTPLKSISIASWGAIASDGSGHFLVAGKDSIVRYSANGQLDPMFGAGGIQQLSDDPISVAPAGNGKILLTIRGGVVMRLLSNGSVDKSFGIGGTTPMLGEEEVSYNALLVQHSGKYIVVGSCLVNHVVELLTARFDRQGMLDPSFGTHGVLLTPDVTQIAETLKYDFSTPALAASAAIRADDRIVVSLGNFVVRQFTRDGTLDPSFDYHGQQMNPNGISGTINAMVVQSDGKIVAAGNQIPAAPGLPSAAALTRYNPDGSLDTGFGIDGKTFVEQGHNAAFRSVLLQPNGDIVAGGFGQSNGQTMFLIDRFLSDGTLDKSFGSGGQVLTSFGDPNGQACASIALQPNGDILAAGSLYGSHGEMQWMAVTRYLPTGALDPSFGIGGHVLLKPSGKVSGATTVLIDKAGRIIVGGSIDNNLGVVRLTGDGAVDRSYGVNGFVMTPLHDEDFPFHSHVIAAQLDKNGNLLVVGPLTSDGTVGEALVRYLPNGKVDSTFADHGIAMENGSEGVVFASSLLIQADGKILVGGVDTGGTSAIVRFTPSGNVDPTFGFEGEFAVSEAPDPSPYLNFSYPPVTALAIQADGKVLAAAGSDITRLLSK